MGVLGIFLLALVVAAVGSEKTESRELRAAVSKAKPSKIYKIILPPVQRTYKTYHTRSSQPRKSKIARITIKRYYGTNRAGNRQANYATNFRGLNNNNAAELSGHVGPAQKTVWGSKRRRGRKEKKNKRQRGGKVTLEQFVDYTRMGKEDYDRGHNNNEESRADEVVKELVSHHKTDAKAHAVSLEHNLPDSVELPSARSSGSSRKVKVIHSEDYQGGYDKGYHGGYQGAYDNGYVHYPGLESKELKGNEQSEFPNDDHWLNRKFVSDDKPEKEPSLELEVESDSREKGKGLTKCGDVKKQMQNVVKYIYGQARTSTDGKPVDEGEVNLVIEKLIKHPQYFVDFMKSKDEEDVSLPQLSFGEIFDKLNHEQGNKLVSDESLDKIPDENRYVTSPADSVTTAHAGASDDKTFDDDDNDSKIWSELYHRKLDTGVNKELDKENVNGGVSDNNKRLDDEGQNIGASFEFNKEITGEKDNNVAASAEKLHEEEKVNAATYDNNENPFDEEFNEPTSDNNEKLYDERVVNEDTSDKYENLEEEPANAATLNNNKKLENEEETVVTSHDKEKLDYKKLDTVTLSPGIETEADKLTTLRNDGSSYFTFEPDWNTNNLEDIVDRKSTKTPDSFVGKVSEDTNDLASFEVDETNGDHEKDKDTAETLSPRYSFRTSKTDDSSTEKSVDNLATVTSSLEHNVNNENIYLDDNDKNKPDDDYFFPYEDDEKELENHETSRLDEFKNVHEHVTGSTSSPRPKNKPKYVWQDFINELENNNDSNLKDIENLAEENVNEDKYNSHSKEEVNRFTTAKPTEEENLKLLVSEESENLESLKPVKDHGAGHYDSFEIHHSGDGGKSIHGILEDHSVYDEHVEDETKLRLPPKLTKLDKQIETLSKNIYEKLADTLNVEDSVAGIPNSPKDRYEDYLKRRQKVSKILIDLINYIRENLQLPRSVRFKLLQEVIVSIVPKLSQSLLSNCKRKVYRSVTNQLLNILYSVLRTRSTHRSGSINFKMNYHSALNSPGVIKFIKKISPVWYIKSNN